MDKQYYNKVFSNQRMQKYFDKYPNNYEKAIVHYKCNIEISGAFYSSLSIFEVALRNSLNRELTRFFGTAEWYLQIDQENGLESFASNIKTAKYQITKRKEAITANKIVEELTLGFWVKLLNAKYERILWKPLRKAFPFMEKEERQRRNVSAPINKIRDFRNRAFHHEPICWNLVVLNTMHSRILKVIGWINEDLPEFAVELDKFPEVLNLIKQRLH